MDPNIRIVIQWLHVLAGVLWIGGGAYTLFVQLPAFLAVAPPARGPVMAQLVPRQLFYILRMAEITIFTGLLQIIATGRGEELSAPFGSRWAGAIVLGIIGALAIYGLIRAVAKPTMERLLGIGARVAAGDAAAANEAPALTARIQNIARVQIAIGFAVIFLMVVARFS
ncbi:MAG TPA: hypothetical protein VGA16_03190 [Candidatus Limnocylindria bacterium]